MLVFTMKVMYPILICAPLFMIGLGVLQFVVRFNRLRRWM